MSMNPTMKYNTSAKACSYLSLIRAVLIIPFIIALVLGSKLASAQNEDPCDIITVSFPQIQPNCAGVATNIGAYLLGYEKLGPGDWSREVWIDFGNGEYVKFEGADYFTTPHVFPVTSTDVTSYTIHMVVQLKRSGYTICNVENTQVIQVPTCSGVACNNFDLESGTTGWSFNTTDYMLVPPDPEALDPYAGFPITPLNGGTVLQLGSDNQSTTTRSAYFSYNAGVPITAENAKLAFRFAFVAEGFPPAQQMPQPGLELIVVTGENPIEGCGFKLISNSVTPEFRNVSGTNIYFLPWTTLFYDLTPFIGEVVTIQFNTYNRTVNGPTGEPFRYFGYAYIDGFCELPGFDSEEVCSDVPIEFKPNFETAFGDEEKFIWDMGDGTRHYQREPVHTYSTPGNYTVTLTYNPPYLPSSPNDQEATSINTYTQIDNIDIPIINIDLFEDLVKTDITTIAIDQLSTRCGGATISQVINVTDCDGGPPFVCETCIPPFSPLPGQRYIITAWAKQGNGIGYSNYDGPSIRINFTQGTTSPYFKPTGLIVDGWQRIEGEFTVPDDAIRIWIELGNENEVDQVFFDDIRVQPFNSSLKSFVYDPITLRLVAELDERHYATFFEYDEEGALVRVKKETERGVKTLSETRLSSRKRTND